jgi:hypothetical protein
MKEKIIKLGMFLGILLGYKVLYAQAIRFNQLLVRDELIVQGTLKVNKLVGLKQDTIIVDYLRARKVQIRKNVLVDTITTNRPDADGFLKGGSWTVTGVLTVRDNVNIHRALKISGGLFLPVGRKWGTDSVIVGNVKYTGTSFKVTGFTFIDTLGVDTLFIWMNETWVNIKP